MNIPFFRPAILMASLVVLLGTGGLASARTIFFPQDPVPASGTWFRLGEAADPTAGLLLEIQCTECEDYEESKPSRAKKGASLNKGFTKTIVAILLHANKTCDSDYLDEIYLIDCLRVYYGWAADAIPARGEYEPVRLALRNAEKKLSAIVSANIDRSAPTVEPREGHKKSAQRLPPLRPVKKSAKKKVVAQAKAVVKETELVILRSGEDPARRTEHFQEVAAAVDSNLVILRSA